MVISALVGAIFFLAGAYVAYSGFRTIGKIRELGRTRTASAASCPEGLVELSGRAASDRPLSDPIYGEPCAFFDLVVEELGGNSPKTRSWMRHHDENSFGIPFFLEDDSGRALVHPGGAQMRVEEKELRPTDRIPPADPALENYLNGHFPAGRENRKLRVRFRVLRLGETLFAHGFAAPTGSLAAGAAVELRHAPDRPLILANQTERDLVRRKLLPEAIQALVLGPVFALVGAAVLAWSLKLL